MMVEDTNQEVSNFLGQPTLHCTFPPFLLWDGSSFLAGFSKIHSKIRNSTQSCPEAGANLRAPGSFPLSWPPFSPQESGILFFLKKEEEEEAVRELQPGT